MVDSATPGYLKTACERMEERRRAEDQPEAWSGVRRGWWLGEEAFRKELLAPESERRRAHHYGAELQEGEEAKAERSVKEAFGAAKVFGG